MSPSPILRALSSIRTSGVRTLLMGGQACVSYGAAEFSRDLDLLLFLDSLNLDRLRTALWQLSAEPVAVPPPGPACLTRGHAVHFRCKRTDVAGPTNRSNVFVARHGIVRGALGAPDYHRGCGTSHRSLALEDFVHSKKTQKDKDWPIIRRLVEQSYFGRSETQDPAQIDFWLRELRTPQLLIELAQANPVRGRLVASSRPAMESALAGDLDEGALHISNENSKSAGKIDFIGSR